MKFSLTLMAALLSGTAALAEDIVIRADISAATVFIDGAELSRTAAVTIPAGEHRLRIVMPDAQNAELLQVRGPDGLIIGPPQRVGGLALGEGQLDSPAQSAARAALEEARLAVVAAQDEIVTVTAAVQAVEAQLAYLQGLTRGGADGVAMPTDPTLVPQFLATLGAETARLQGELQAAQIVRRDLSEALVERQEEMNAAQAELVRLRPFGRSVAAVEVTVRAEAEVTGPLSLSYYTADAGWEPQYELHLDTEARQLQVERLIHLHAPGNAVWQDVTVTFSTATPARDRAPQTLYPSVVRIMEPPVAEPQALGGIMSLESRQAGFADVTPAPVMVVEEAAMAEVIGLSLSYRYARPVSVGETGEILLPFDALAFDVETEARAVPRHDATAFLLATLDNDSGEPILPGEALFYRDGALIGVDHLPLVAAGEEIDIAFGPLDHLRLTWIDRSLAEGDSGVFTTSTTQDRALAFGVENTSDTAETVRLYYATPFAEQEDLELDLSLSPAPTLRDVDDLRGVHVWEVEVAPGATSMVEMTLELSWPEGQILNWRP